MRNEIIPKDNSLEKNTKKIGYIECNRKLILNEQFDYLKIITLELKVNQIIFIIIGKIYIREQ